MIDSMPPIWLPCKSGRCCQTNHLLDHQSIWTEKEIELMMPSKSEELSFCQKLPVQKKSKHKSMKILTLRTNVYVPFQAGKSV